MRLAINGALGRMGRMVLDAARAAGDVEDVVLFDQAGHPGTNEVAQTPFGERHILTDPTLMPDHVDAGIDFSSPAGAVAFVQALTVRDIPVVSGTTGLSDDDHAAMRSASRQAPVLWTPNTSLGVFCLHEIASMARNLLGPGYDCEIVEIHHRHKKDAPSGTALSLAHRLAVGPEAPIVARQGQTGERHPGSIGVMAMRGGEVVGEHTVMFLGDHDRIEITHRAASRLALAKGAVDLARRLMGKPAGLYTLKDLLTNT